MTAREKKPAPRRAAEPALRLFVYGTLKRGQRNHAARASDYLSAEPAMILGRLFESPAGWPVLDLPDGAALQRGTADGLADARAAEQAEEDRTAGRGGGALDPMPSGNWRRIEGELFTFDEPARRLRELDEFEEFSPGQPSPFHRVLAWIDAGRPVAAWTYVLGDFPEILENARPLKNRSPE